MMECPYYVHFPYKAKQMFSGSWSKRSVEYESQLKARPTHFCRER